jgi:hypothetical protein
MMILLIKSLVAYMYDSMAHKFEELVLDEHNYPTWALDIKISLAFYEIMDAHTPPVERDAAFLNTFKYHALYIIRNHLHLDLKSEYVMEQ